MRLRSRRYLCEQFQSGPAPGTRWRLRHDGSVVEVVGPVLGWPSGEAQVVFWQASAGLLWTVSLEGWEGMVHCDPVTCESV